jgi:hypothetical protein
VTRIVRKVIITGATVGTFASARDAVPGNNISGFMDMSCSERLAHRIYMPSC